MSKQILARSRQWRKWWWCGYDTRKVVVGILRQPTAYSGLALVKVQALPHPRQLGPPHCTTLDNWTTGFFVGLTSLGHRGTF